MRPKVLYVVQRGPKPDYHRAPFHPVIVCTRRHTAMWEAGPSGNCSWVWSRGTANDGGEGFLLVRWNGLDIDYGHIVHAIAMPDGTQAAFSHPHKNERPWCLLPGAIWWSDHDLPEWLAGRGVIHPEDDFTRESIESDSGTCVLTFSQQERLARIREPA